MNDVELYILFRSYWSVIWPLVVILVIAWAYLMIDDWRKKR